jgi:AcrR family transcriptional regulator
MENQRSPKTGRPGGRSERVRRKVIEAVHEVLNEQGVVGLTLERVAKNAGVHRSTLYRRWHTMDSLLADTVMSTADRMLPASPDNGNLRQDLTGMAHLVRDGLAEAGMLARALFSHSAASEEMTVFARWFWSRRVGLWLEILRRGVERGELKPDANFEAIALAVYAPVYMRAMIHEPATDELIDSLIDQALASNLVEPS